MDLLESTSMGRGEARRHPWELARVRAVGAILEANLPAPPARILDFGCGDAFAGLTLAARWPRAQLRCVDSNFDDADLRELRRRHPDARFDRALEAEGEAPYDLLLLLDVLEHIGDDRGVLAGLVDEVLAPRGHVMITAPAFPALYGAHDRFLRHERRYDRLRLDQVIEASGLQVLQRGYLFGSLLPARVLSMALSRWRPGEGEGGARWSGGATVTRLLTAVLNLDNRLLLALSSRAIHLPGLSLWALCRRPR